MKNAKGLLFITSFIPVIVFKVISRGGAGTLDQAKFATLLGLILAAVQFGLSRRFFKQNTYLERAFLGFLAFGTAWIYLAPPEEARLFADYSTFLLYSTMFLVTLLPQLFGYEPFTFSIAKQWYPETVWNVPQFLTINLHITYFWSGVFLAAAISCFFGHGRWPFTIVLPFVFILGVGLPFSRLYPGRYLKRRFSGEIIDLSLLPDSARRLVLEMPKSFNAAAGAGIKGDIQFDLSGGGGRKDGALHCRWGVHRLGGGERIAHPDHKGTGRGLAENGPGRDQPRPSLHGGTLYRGRGHGPSDQNGGALQTT